MRQSNLKSSHVTLSCGHVTLTCGHVTPMLLSFGYNIHVHHAVIVMFIIIIIIIIIPSLVLKSINFVVFN